MLEEFKEKIKKEPLTESEYQLVKLQLPTWRDGLIIKTLRNTGLRQGELLAVEKRHCSLAGPEFFILIKRSKDPAALHEKVFLNPNLGVELRDWISGQGIGQGDRIFNISARRLQQVFKEASIKALGHQVRPHALRNLYIKYGLDKDGLNLNIEVMAKLVGHKSITTTLNSYYDLDSDEKREINERTPV